jgi:hypothetical protein
VEATGLDDVHLVADQILAIRPILAANHKIAAFFSVQRIERHCVQPILIVCYSAEGLRRAGRPMGASAAGCGIHGGPVSEVQDILKLLGRPRSVGGR